MQGYDGYMPLDLVLLGRLARSSTRSQVAARTDQVAVPIYRLQERRSNFEYEVIGWVGFVMTSFCGNSARSTAAFSPARSWKAFSTYSLQFLTDFGVALID